MSDPEFRDPNAPSYGQPWDYPATPYGPWPAPPSSGYPGQAQPGVGPPTAGNPYSYLPPPNPYYYGPTPGDRRPGTLTASAVLGYVTAGLLIIAAVYVFTGAAVVADLSDDTVSHRGVGGELVVAGFVNLIAAGLFIGGGVAMTGRSWTGRTLYAVAGALTVVAAFYWAVRFALRYDEVVGLLFFALVFTALSVVGVCLAFAGAGSRWLAARPISRP